jgi:phosphoribosyl 1,2-cyclic phosphate phosphodiesterase
MNNRMKLICCGSGASEGIPALFCDCQICRNARLEKGREIRRRSAYQLGQKIHVDFGPDSFWQMNHFALDYTKLQELFITHDHRDHLHAPSLGYRNRIFSSGVAPMTLRADAAVLDKISIQLREHNTTFEECQIEPVPLTDGIMTDLPEDGLKFCSYPANHGGHAHLISFHRNNFGLLIGHDSGYFSEACWEMMKNRKFDLVLLDCTYGSRSGVDHNDCHMSLETIREVMERLGEMGCLGDNAQVIATHFSHNGMCSYEELCRLTENSGIQVAYDGMSWNLPCE